jgi:hypothetical protein
MQHTGPMLHCSKCDFSSRNKGTVDKHFKFRHTDKMKKTCPFCGVTFKKLDHHLQVSLCGKDKDDRERHTCKICGKKILFAAGIKKHMEQQHLKDKNWTKDENCPHCSYKSNKKFNLKMHLDRVHGTGLNVQRCPHCNKRTYYLESHMKTYHIEHFMENETTIPDVSGLFTEGPSPEALEAPSLTTNLTQKDQLNI